MMARKEQDPGQVPFVFRLQKSFTALGWIFASFYFAAGERKTRKSGHGMDGFMGMFTAMLSKM